MAVANIPAPTAMPMLAITKMVAALVMPSTAAAIANHDAGADESDAGNDLRGDARVVAAHFAGHFVGNDGEERRAEADQHVGANSGGLAAKLAFQADHSAEERRKHEAQQNVRIQVVQHDTPVPCAPRFYWNVSAELSAIAG